MAIVAAQDFLRVWLNAIVAQWSGFTLHLFVNDYVPTPLLQWTDFDEATFPGYSSAPLASWGYAVTQADHTAKVVEVIHSFTQLSVPSPVQSVYGYFVVNPLGLAVWAERNEGGPVRMDTAGLPYVVRPSMVLANLVFAGVQNVSSLRRRRPLPVPRPADPGSLAGDTALRKGRAPGTRMRRPS